MSDYMNKCYRGGPCLFADQKSVIKEAYWDYYDRQTRSFVYLDCRIHQKYQTPGLLEIEDAEKYHSGSGLASYETPDLQLADYNGRWMTRSDDPDCYAQPPFEESKTCSICDLVCEIRDEERYLNSDGSCPYPDPGPVPTYWKVQDGDGPCQEFLHPMLLQNIEAINRKRRKAAKAYIWKSLKEPRWMHALINSGQRIVDVWERNYQPAQVYYRSFETIWLFLKSLPRQRRTSMFLSYVFNNLKYHPQFDNLLQDETERKFYEKIEDLVTRASMK